ncbi:MAG: hypothetical protein HUJ90_00105, partial [Bacteroidales bacterium]|nr:hypothetical protein [Bacteroidales bacterium]
MKKFLFTLLAALLTLPAALAQSWSGQTVDPTLYTGSRHVVYLKLNDPNETVNGTTLDVSKFIIVAFVGEGENAQLRSYDIGPQGEWNPDQTMTTKNHYFPITIFGEPAENGKPISFRLWDREKSLEYVLPLNLTYSDGATASYPSQATAVDFTPVQSYSYPEDFYINKGETREFPITYVPANASHPIIAINTQSENISIDGFNVTGNEYGYFYLYLANWQGFINGFVVNPIESVTITDPEKLYVGELRELQLNIVGKDHNDTEYVYCDINVVYNNPTIVDDYGKGHYYNALSRGTATATVTVTGKTSTTPIILTAHFNVLQPITDITVPETAQILWSHKSYNVNQFITVTPDVVDEKVAYGVTDSYSDVIGVDADGNIEIKGIGRAQINVWPEDHERPLRTIKFEIKKAATDFSVKDNPIYMIKDTRK